MNGFCECHNLPRAGNRQCRVKYRQSHRKYERSTKGYLAERRRRLEKARAGVCDALNVLEREEERILDDIRATGGVE